MRDGSRVFDVGDLETNTVECANRRFPAGSRTLDHYVQVFQSVFSSRVTGSFSCYLRSKGVLLREPRNPEPPAVAHDRTLPWRSDRVTMVLLNDA